MQGQLFVSLLDCTEFTLTDEIICKAFEKTDFKTESEFLLYLDDLGITTRLNTFKKGGAEKFNSLFPLLLSTNIH